MARPERANLFTLPNEECIRTDIYSRSPLLGSRHEGTLDFALGTGVEDNELQAEAVSRRVNARALDFDRPRVIRIGEEGNLGGSGDHLMQQLHLLCSKRHCDYRDTSGVAAWPIKARDKPGCDGIRCGGEYDRNGSGGTECCPHAGNAAAD